MEQGTWSSGTGNGLNCCLYVNFYCTLTKKLKHPCRNLKKTAIPLGFINDQLSVSLDRRLDRPSCLVLVDAEKVVGRAPKRKTSHLFPNFDLLGRPFLLLKQGVHKLSPAETLAPFYQDPTQRIAALFVNHSFGFPEIGRASCRERV